jgi:AraC family ethanolamine operon transcriptional activator
MFQRKPLDRFQAPATLPDRSRMPHSRCSNQRNIDLGQFVSRVHGFRLELLQMDPGAFRADGFQAYLGDVLIGIARFGRALIQTWRSPAHSITLAVGTSPPPALWQGTSFGRSDLLIAGPDTEIELVSQPGFGVASVSFPEHEFHRASKLLGCDSIIDEPNRILFRLPKMHTAYEIRTAIQTLISEVSAHPSGAQTHKWEQAKRDDVLRRMVLAASGGIPFNAPRAGAERAQALAQAVSAIRDRPADVLTVAALCRIAGASKRTLHYAFVERYGLPPARFMKAYRLNGVRNELGQIISRELKVSDIANKWGFWHLGQFAKDYRLWFGELPSETRRRAQVEI